MTTPTFEYIDAGHVHLTLHTMDPRALRGLAEVVKTLLLDEAQRRAAAASNCEPANTLSAQDNTQDATCSASKP